jgi:uncharacterized membrane protein YdjX (TVP38/TMEM64 family)
MKEDKNSFVWVILGFIISGLSIYFVSKNINVISKFIGAVGILGPLLSIVLYGVLAATPIPTDPITLVNGALFGPVLGSLISWCGNNLAAFIEYFLGRGIRNLTNFEKIRKKLPLGIGKLPVDSVGFLLFGRFVPQVGGKIVSLMGGIYKVPLKRYMWTAALSNLIGSILFALGGWGFLRAIITL